MVHNEVFSNHCVPTEMATPTPCISGWRGRSARRSGLVCSGNCSRRVRFSFSVSSIGLGLVAMVGFEAELGLGLGLDLDLDLDLESADKRQRAS